MAPSSNDPTWTITGQAPGYGLNKAGAFVKGYDVSFATKSGAQGTVFVAMSDYTIEKVKAAVAEHAETLEALAGAQG